MKLEPQLSLKSRARRELLARHRLGRVDRRDKIIEQVDGVHVRRARYERDLVPFQEVHANIVNQRAAIAALLDEARKDPQNIEPITALQVSPPLPQC